MKKPKTLIEAFKLAEGCTTRKKAKKILKSYKKLTKHVPIQESETPAN